MSTHQPSRIPTPDCTLLGWLPVVAAAWMGAALRTIVMLIFREPLDFGSTLAVAVAVCAPVLGAVAWVSSHRRAERGRGYRPSGASASALGEIDLSSRGSSRRIPGAG